MSNLYKHMDRLEEVIGFWYEGRRSDWKRHAVQVLRSLAMPIRSLGLTATEPQFYTSMAMTALNPTEAFSPSASVKPGFLGKRVVRLWKSKFGIRFSHIERIRDVDTVETTWSGGSYDNFVVRLLEVFPFEAGAKGRPVPEEARLEIMLYGKGTPGDFKRRIKQFL